MYGVLLAGERVVALVQQQLFSISCTLRDIQ